MGIEMKSALSSRRLSGVNESELQCRRDSGQSCTASGHFQFHEHVKV